MTDAFQLQRFISAQDKIYDDVIGELTRGSKETHWMWFIFPQFAGLGQSPTAIHYSLASEAEARAYLKHSILGTRLKECADKVLQINNKSADEIFGQVDAMKLCSSMTLFDKLQSSSVFESVLEQFFHGRRDQKTLVLLESASSSQ